MVQKKKKKNNNNNNSDSDSDDDETFYYRYSSSSAPPQKQQRHQSSSSSSSSSKSHINKPSNGSGSLAPSKSTVYVSNIDYSLTNSDLHTIFSTFGKLARVTIVKDRLTRLSRGVAFIQFVSRDDALRAAREMHGKVLNGRTLTASIAADNGRAPEFIKKRVYVDKSKCYECGGLGHLSYECPKNQLGPRERPVAKRVRRGGGGGGGGGGGNREEEGSDGGEEFDDDNWASVVDGGAEERVLRESQAVLDDKKMMRMKKSSYFSDESDEDE